MIFVCPVLFVVWKVVKGTKFRRAEEIDLVTYVEDIDEYQRTYVEEPARFVLSPFSSLELAMTDEMECSNWFVRFLDWAFG